MSVLEHHADVQSHQFVLSGVYEAEEVGTVFVPHVGSEVFEEEGFLIDYPAVLIDNQLNRLLFLNIACD